MWIIERFLKNETITKSKKMTQFELKHPQYIAIKQIASNLCVENKSHKPRSTKKY